MRPGSNRRAPALLVAVALLAFLPGFFQIPPVDRDEAYFAQATKQMIETGDYVDIRYQDDVRYRKPVGIYWLQAAVVNTAGALGMRNALTTIWLYRVPSLIGCDRRGACDLLVRAGLCEPARRGSGRFDDGGFGAARRRSPPRQDRRRSAFHRDRRHGRLGAGLSRAAPQRRQGRSALARWRLFGRRSRSASWSRGRSF